jgi:hypothetical protein
MICKPSAQPTMVRIHHPPPPAKMRPDLRIRRSGAPPETGVRYPTSSHALPPRDKSHGRMTDQRPAGFGAGSSSPPPRPRLGQATPRRVWRRGRRGPAAGDDRDSGHGGAFRQDRAAARRTAHNRRCGAAGLHRPGLRHGRPRRLAPPGPGSRPASVACASERSGAEAGGTASGQAGRGAGRARPPLPVRAATARRSGADHIRPPVCPAHKTYGDPPSRGAAQPRRTPARGCDRRDRGDHV